jgi:hypothetical protein
MQAAGMFASELAGLETPLVALDMVQAARSQAELSFLKFPADRDEALLLGFVQCLQTCAFGGRLPIRAFGAMQQNHDLDNFTSPWPFTGFAALFRQSACSAAPVWPVKDTPLI